MNGHPKWCAVDAHQHVSAKVEAGFVEVWLVQDGDEEPGLLVTVDDPNADELAATTLTLDEAQVLSAGLLSLLMRTDAA